MNESQLSFEEEHKFIKGVELFNQREWYLAHDLFEEIWHNINGLERITIQSILLIAVAELHLENGNLSGAVILYGEGFGRIVNNNLPNLGIDINRFSMDVEEKFRTLQNGGDLEEMKYPTLIKISPSN